MSGQAPQPRLPHQAERNANQTSRRLRYTQLSDARSASPLCSQRKIQLVSCHALLQTTDRPTMGHISRSEAHRYTQEACVSHRRHHQSEPEEPRGKHPSSQYQRLSSWPLLTSKSHFQVPQLHQKHSPVKNPHTKSEPQTHTGVFSASDIINV